MHKAPSFMLPSIQTLFTTLLLVLLSAHSVFAAQPDDSLDKEAEALKQELIKLNQDLSAFEQNFLYPPEVQLSVFLSLSDKTTFRLDSIEISVDGALVASHLYQEDDIAALKTGGIQQLYIGSVGPGKHKLSASFNGQGSSGSYFRRKKSLTFIKESNARYIQLIVSESPGAGEPLFKVKQW